MFLCEYPYKGSIKIAGNELSELDDAKKAGLAAYLGHDPELFNDTIRNNILMGDDEDVAKLLKAVCFDKEVNDMEKRTGHLCWEYRCETVRRTGTETCTCQNTLP